MISETSYQDEHPDYVGLPEDRNFEKIAEWAVIVQIGDHLYGCDIVVSAKTHENKH